MFRKNRIWKVLSLFIFFIISFQVLAKEISHTESAHERADGLAKNHSQSYLNTSKIIRCFMEVPKNYLTHITNSNYSLENDESHCRHFFDMRQKQRDYDRSSFINYYLIPSLIKEPVTKSSVIECLQHVLSKNTRMLTLKALTSKNFTLASTDSLRVLIPTTVSAGAYLLTESLVEKSSLLTKSHKALMVGTIIYTANNNLEKETYGVVATNVAFNLVLSYGLTRDTLKRLSQIETLSLSALTVLPISLFIESVQTNTKPGDLQRNITYFKDELYISSIVVSAIPFVIDSIKYFFYGFNDRNGISLLDSHLDVFKESFLRGTLASSVDGIYFKLSEKHDLSKDEALSRVVSRIAVRSANFITCITLRHLTGNHRIAHFFSFLPGLIYIASYTPSFY